MSDAEIKQIPNMTVHTSDGVTDLYSLSGTQGLILYFYPKDMTPGCTKQACDFRDSYAEIKAAGWSIVGVSTDGLESHDKFIAKHSLPFTLIADTDRALALALGMWVEKSMFGVKYQGMQRSICIMDTKGEVVKIWRKVSVTTHLKNLLKFLDSI